MLSEKTIIVTGATGRVGSAVVSYLLKEKVNVRAIIRDSQKAVSFKKNGAEVVIADFFDKEALMNAFSGGDTVFLITPENPVSSNILEDTKQILQNYRQAISGSGITKLVGLSSIGAQYATGTGNLQMSYMLEHGFEDLPVEQVFIRPSYYFSNWMVYLDAVREQGFLPVFFPVDMKIPMIAPEDVAKFVTECILSGEKQQDVFEITGPSEYSSRDVASLFARAMNQPAEAFQIPREEWKGALVQAGFSGHASNQLIKMTETVIAGKTVPGKNAVTMPTSLEKYLERKIETL